MVEIEIRARADGIDVEGALGRAGAVLRSEGRERDEYLKFSGDAERKLIFRVREKNGKQKFTIKGKSIAATDTAWPEWETPIEHGDDLIRLLLSNGFERVTTIVKRRKQYALKAFEINIDEIEGLGTFVEIELMHDDPEHAHREILRELETLGIPESRIVKKGYVQLMLEGATR